MAVIGAFRAAKGSRVQYNSVNLTLANWNCNESADDLDTNCFENGGIDQGTIGFVKLDFDFDGNWDADQPKWTSPPGIIPTDDSPAINFFINVNDASKWTIPTARILSTANGAPVKQLVTYKASGKGQPGWTNPGESAP